MAKYAQAGADLNYRIDFAVDGELVVPTSATISLQKPDGTYLLTDAAVTLVSGQTFAYHTIGAVNNTKTLAYELRYVTVKFVFGGRTYTQTDVYSLQDSMLLPVTRDEVRSLVAMTSAELPDSQIDLVYAYGQVVTDVGEEVNVGNLLSGGSALTPSIQQAIRIKAALNSCLMLELMVYQSEQADNTIYNRFTNFDFEALFARLTGLYGEALMAIAETVEATPQRFVVVTDTDPVTGA